MSDQAKPMTLMISGPQGVGKTRLSRGIAELLFEQGRSCAITDEGERTLHTVADSVVTDEIVVVQSRGALKVGHTLKHRFPYHRNAQEAVVKLVVGDIARIETTGEGPLQSTWISTSPHVRPDYVTSMTIGAVGAWPTPGASGVQLVIPAGDEIAAFCDSVHADNVAAGWWSDPKTGKRIDRNVGELLCLSKSEIAEASLGVDEGSMDDKLPHRLMVEVELADTAIRIADMGGGLGLDIGGAWDDLVRFGGISDMDYGVPLPANVLTSLRLLRIVRELADAMEGHRKSKNDSFLAHRGVLRPEIEVRLAAALMRVYRLAAESQLDLDGAIAEKRAFNKVRPDHKLEARKAAGGKKY